MKSKKSLKSEKSVLTWSLDKHSVLPLNCSEPLGRKSAGAVGRDASREELGVEPRDRAREVRGAAIEARRPAGPDERPGVEELLHPLQDSCEGLRNVLLPQMSADRVRKRMVTSFKSKLLN